MNTTDKPTKEVIDLAKVICKSEGYIFDDLLKDRKEVQEACCYGKTPHRFYDHDIHQAKYIEQAVAALEHLRDNPSDRMIRAAGKTGQGVDTSVIIPRIMNAALGEE
jgi:hypothetical protein